MKFAKQYFDGEKLYGDDLKPEEIEQWFKDEIEGFSDQTVGGTDYKYAHHALNQLHGFSFIKNRHFESALSVGGARADEYKPIANQVGKITVLEPSDAYNDVYQIGHVPCEYIKPVSSGDMPFIDDSFDLLTVFGALHHIPNVSHVIGECYRVLAPGGIALIREPIVSMGDWTKPRKGLTKHERGIPLKIMQKIIKAAGFIVRHEAMCGFMGIGKIANDAHNRSFWTWVDSMCCKILAYNYRYHPIKLWQKFTPTSAFYVLKKRTHSKHEKQ